MYVEQAVCESFLYSGVTANNKSILFGQRISWMQWDQNIVDFVDHHCQRDSANYMSLIIIINLTVKSGMFRNCLSE